MTVATAYAYVANDHRAMLGILADARLSWRDETAADMAVKTHELSPRIAAVSAGTALVGAAAAELARSIIATTAARPGRSVSLWGATKLFAHFARVVQRPLRENRGETIANEFAIAGFYNNGAPGVAWVELYGDREQVSFWRPTRGQLASVTVGESSVKDLIQAAYGDRATQLERRDRKGHDTLASAFWYLIKSEAETMRSIGGGLAAGHCLGPNFVWPIVEIEGQRFYRGIPVSEADIPRDPNETWVFRPAIDVNEAAELDQLVADGRHRFAGRFTSTPHFTRTLDELGSPFLDSPEPRELDFVSL